MKTIIHSADLHLAVEEQDYSFKVLSEVLQIAKKKSADFLLFAGDLFNSFKDAEVLRVLFREQLAEFKKVLPRCEVLFLPGNHEYLRIGQTKLTHLDLGPLTVLEETPFSLLSFPELEILAIPHQSHYKNYIEWSVPPKQAPFRLAIAHGSVSGMTYMGTANGAAGIDGADSSPEEEGGAVLDPDIFTRFKVDYAALGHIHATRQQKTGATLLYYPGSARVWRKGELGPRLCNCIQLDKQITVSPFILQSAGQYRYCEWPLDLNGELPARSRDTTAWRKEDWLVVHLTGVVEDERKVAALANKLNDHYGPQVRRLEVLRDDVLVLEGIASQPVARKFLALWEKQAPAADDFHARKVWLKARELALHKVVEYLKART